MLLPTVVAIASFILENSCGVAMPIFTFF